MLSKYFFRFLSIVSLFFLFSCQSEIAEQLYDKQETITKDTPLTSYLQRLAMVTTIDDNIIDKSSYCTIKFPYTVKVNYVTVTINSAADYQKVSDITNANPNATVKINFPVTMIYFNYIEKLIENQSGYDSLLAYWNSKPDLLSKINCLSVNYPLTINIYNSSKQMASSVTIIDDKSLFSFVNNLNTSQYIALSYPITLIDDSKQIITIENNSQLENAIKDALDNCMSNSNVSLDFNDVITKNSWKISYYYDEKDKTQSYSGYEFTFKSDQTATATKSGVTINGQWSIKTENDGQKVFKISFNTDLLHQLDEDWNLFEFNNSQLRFRKEEGSNDNHYLYFEKI